MLKYIVPVLVVVAAVGSSRRAAHLQGQPLSLAFIQHQGWSLVLTGLQAVLSSGALAGPRASGTARHKQKTPTAAALAIAALRLYR